jgi:hypothetical protein
LIVFQLKHQLALVCREWFRQWQWAAMVLQPFKAPKGFRRSPPTSANRQKLSLDIQQHGEADTPSEVPIGCSADPLASLESDTVLAPYFPLMRQHGFDNLAVLHSLNEEQLSAMMDLCRIHKLGHQFYLINLAKMSSAACVKAIAKTEDQKDQPPQSSRPPVKGMRREPFRALLSHNREKGAKHQPSAVASVVEPLLLGPPDDEANQRAVQPSGEEPIAPAIGTPTRHNTMDWGELWRQSPYENLYENPVSWPRRDPYLQPAPVSPMTALDFDQLTTGQGMRSPLHKGESYQALVQLLHLNREPPAKEPARESQRGLRSPQATKAPATSVSPTSGSLDRIVSAIRQRVIRSSPPN